MICEKCSRLCAFLEENRRLHPTYFNAPVPNFGDENASLLIVGLAPGLNGANQNGKPFTGDFAGRLLYPTLIKYGFATGIYQEKPNNGLTLHNALITNAVLCVPPENKPTGQEITTCNENLKKTISSLPNLKVILSLGHISHNAVLKAFGLKQSSYIFKHNGIHCLPNGVILIDSFHCSLYNTATKRLTTEMFEAVFDTIKNYV